MMTRESVVIFLLGTELGGDEEWMRIRRNGDDDEGI